MDLLVEPMLKYLILLPKPLDSSMNLSRKPPGEGQPEMVLGVVQLDT